MRSHPHVKIHAADMPKTQFKLAHGIKDVAPSFIAPVSDCTKFFILMSISVVISDTLLAKQVTGYRTQTGVTFLQWNKRIIYATCNTQYTSLDSMAMQPLATFGLRALTSEVKVQWLPLG